MEWEAWAAGIALPPCLLAVDEITGVIIRHIAVALPIEIERLRIDLVEQHAATPSQIVNQEPGSRLAGREAIRPAIAPEQRDLIIGLVVAPTVSEVGTCHGVAAEIEMHSVADQGVRMDITDRVLAPVVIAEHPAWDPAEEAAEVAVAAAVVVVVVAGGGDNRTERQPDHRSTNESIYE